MYVYVQYRVQYFVTYAVCCVLCSTMHFTLNLRERGGNRVGTGKKLSPRVGNGDKLNVRVGDGDKAITAGSGWGKFFSPCRSSRLTLACACSCWTVQFAKLVVDLLWGWCVPFDSCIDIVVCLTGRVDYAVAWRSLWESRYDLCMVCSWRICRLHQPRLRVK
jgi:hypothetical protein